MGSDPPLIEIKLATSKRKKHVFYVTGPDNYDILFPWISYKINHMILYISHVYTKTGNPKMRVKTC